MLMNTSEKCKKKVTERGERKDKRLQRKTRQDSLDKPMPSKKGMLNLTLSVDRLGGLGDRDEEGRSVYISERGQKVKTRDCS